MTLTTFPNGISSFGIPVLGGAALPFTGNYYFVDPVNGLDGRGGGFDEPFKTLAAAYARCRDGYNDVVYIIGNGLSTGAATLAAQLVWAKNACHLIGLGTQTAVGNPARIAIQSGVTGFPNMVTVTGQGCVFANFSVTQGYNVAEDQKMWIESGAHNTYANVQFAGMLDATPSGRAGSRSLIIDGGVAAGTTGRGEHTFVGCTFGSASVARTAANASLEVSGASPSNTFDDCTFAAFATNAGVLHYNIPASGIVGTTTMKRPKFLNNLKGASGTAMTAVAVVNATQAGMILMENPVSVGATDLEQTPTNYQYIIGPVPTAATSGLAVNNA